ELGRQRPGNRHFGAEDAPRRAPPVHELEREGAVVEHHVIVEPEPSPCAPQPVHGERGPGAGDVGPQHDRSGNSHPLAPTPCTGASVPDVDWWTITCRRRYEFSAVPVVISP